MQTRFASEQIPNELNKGDMKKIMYSHKSKQGKFWRVHDNKRRIKYARFYDQYLWNEDA